MGLIGKLQPGEEVDDPGAAPTGMTAAVAQAEFERFASGLDQSRSLSHIPLMARVETEQMRDVPMTRLRLLIGPIPLQQPPVVANFRR